MGHQVSRYGIKDGLYTEAQVFADPLLCHLNGSRGPKGWNVRVKDGCARAEKPKGAKAKAPSLTAPPAASSAESLSYSELVSLWKKTNGGRRPTKAKLLEWYAEQP